MLIRFSRTALSMAVLSISSFTAVHAAEDASKFPSRPVKFVVSYAPGGVTDVSTRLLAETLSKRTGQSFIVENRAGAGGEIGAEFVARAEPDGYTIMMAAAGGIISPIFRATNPATEPRSFAYVSMVSSSLNFFITSPTSGFRSMRALVEAARLSPGKYNYGSPGMGTFGHLVPAVFAKAAGVQIEHVPYKGTSQALVDLMGDRITLGQATTSSIKTFVEAGKLVPLAVVSHKRAASFPQVPTIAEAGFPQFIAKSTWEPWQVVVAPKGTPPAIVARLNNLVNAALRDAELAKRYDGLGLNIYPAASPAGTEKFVKNEFDTWLAASKTLGVKID